VPKNPLDEQEYLKSTYSPDREYRDGVLIERNVGSASHSLLQAALAAYLRNRRKQWSIQVYTELRIRMREGWYPLPDVCVYPLPAPEERFPSKPPLLWIEILSEDDRMIEVWDKAREVIALGTPYVWIIDPTTLDSELRTSGGAVQLADQTLRLPDPPIVIPLVDVLAE
jgi:Uma2 family endonuclease